VLGAGAADDVCGAEGVIVGGTVDSVCTGFTVVPDCPSAAPDRSLGPLLVVAGVTLGVEGATATGFAVAAVVCDVPLGADAVETGAEALGAEALGAEALGAEALGAEALGAEAPGAPAFAPRLVGGASSFSRVFVWAGSTTPDALRL